jgi:hypothetical protein
MSGWSRRIRLRSQELQDMRDAAQDLGRQAGHAPGRVGTAFRTVADCALIGTAVISGALASIHLYKALHPREDKHGREPQPQGSGDDLPPHRHIAIVADRHHGHGRS